MQWSDPVLLENEAVKIPRNWLFLHYYEALTVLFRIENALRVFVYVALKEKKKSSWSSLMIVNDDGTQTSIAAAAKKRISQDESFGYLGYPISSPLMHLTSGELIRIILADSYWPMFAEYFPASKDLVRTKLEEIGNVRNALAHFRPVKQDDVQVVKQNANQVLSRVEAALASAIDCNDIVPTNSKEEWYNQLRVLSGPYCGIEFKQSDDEKWIQIGLRYDCPILGQPYVGTDYRSYRVLSLNTPSMLKRTQVILDNVIFVSDYVPYLNVPAEGHPRFNKTVQFLFSRTVIREYHAEIKQELENALRQITTETDLIREDNLARGEIVQSAGTSASRSGSADKNRWDVNTRNLHSPERIDSPTEYWGGKVLFGKHFLTNTETFPWMLVDISNFDLPF